MCASDGGTSEVKMQGTLTSEMACLELTSPGDSGPGHAALVDNGSGDGILGGARSIEAREKEQFYKEVARLLYTLDSNPASSQTTPPVFRSQQLRVLERMPSAADAQTLQDKYFILRPQEKRARETAWSSFTGVKAFKGVPITLTKQDGFESDVVGAVLKASASLKEPESPLKAKRFLFEKDFPQDGGPQTSPRTKKLHALIHIHSLAMAPLAAPVYVATTSAEVSSSAGAMSVAEGIERFLKGTLSAPALQDICDPRTGFTALHVAARQGDFDLADKLLTGGFNANIRSNKNRTTPLHLAAYIGDVELGCLLLSHGADVKAKTIGNYMAFHNAILDIPNRNGTCLVEKQKEFIRLLVQAGMEPPDPDDLTGHPIKHLNLSLLREGCLEARDAAADLSLSPEVVSAPPKVLDNARSPTSNLNTLETPGKGLGLWVSDLEPSSPLLLGRISTPPGLWPAANAATGMRGGTEHGSASPEPGEGETESVEGSSSQSLELWVRT